MTDQTLARPKRRKMSPGLKFATELGPLLVFLAFNFQAHRFFDNVREDNIFYATGAFMVAIVAALAISISIERRPAVMPLITGVLVLVMGGLTLYLQDDLFIKLKPTIVNTLFAVALVSGLAFGQLFIKLVLGHAFQMNDQGWRVMTWRWAGFFLFLALVNELVWRTQSTDFWVQFKVYGFMPMTMAFAMWQIRLISRYPAPPKPDAEADDA